MKLTREQIDTMKAGRELDALIAERVMGWEVHVMQKGGEIISDPTNRYERFFWRGRPNTSPPNYSTNIADAWQVVEKLQAPPDEYFFSISMTPAIPHKGAPCWHVEFGGQHAYAPTPTLAICRAALLAVIAAR